MTQGQEHRLAEETGHGHPCTQLSLAKCATPTRSTRKSSPVQAMSNSLACNRLTPDGVAALHRQGRDRLLVHSAGKFVMHRLRLYLIIAVSCGNYVLCMLRFACSRTTMHYGACKVAKFPVRKDPASPQGTLKVESNLETSSTPSRSCMWCPFE